MKRLSVLLSFFLVCLLLTSVSAQVPTERILLGNFIKGDDNNSQSGRTWLSAGRPCEGWHHPA